MISKFKKTCLIILICLINVHSYAGNNNPNIFYAKVLKIVDGDTIHLMHKKYGKIKVRLAEIDAPEIDQPHGKKTTNILFKMIDNKIVKLKKITTDRYSRVVGLVYYQNIEINHYLVRNGLAWCYDKYNKRAKIKNAENMARLEKIGIWSNDAVAPIEPWKWRKNRKKNE